jgi:hypothetical protein
MAATTTANHLNTLSEVKLLDHDPDTGSAAYVNLDNVTPAAGVPIANFRRFRAIVSPTVGTGGLTAFSIGGATAADGTGYVAAVSHAVGSNPDAVNDQLTLECTAEQLREVVSGATHVCVSIDAVTSTDEFKVMFERAEPFQGPRHGLTADYVS